MNKQIKKHRKKFPFHIIVFLAPAVIIYTMFMVYPLIDSLKLSFFSKIEGSEVFVGLKNFSQLLNDPNWKPRFWGAMKNNLIFFIIHMVVQNPLGLVLAALISMKSIKGRDFYRVIYFMPTILSFVIVGFVWQLILSPLWGIGEGIMGFLHLEEYFKPWLGLDGSALIALSLISVWQFIGIPMMLIYTSLIGIPDELVEAAIIDGASGWKVFWRIKFPIILPTIGMVGILTFVGNFNAFDLIYTTQGALAGPNFSTDLMGTLFYRTFFGQQLQMGNPTMGATVAAMMFLTILLGVLFYMFGWQRRVTTYDI